MGQIKIKTDTNHKTMQCGSCGVWHAIPVVMFDSCYDEGGYWSCPNGHSRGFSEGDTSKQLAKEQK